MTIPGEPERRLIRRKEVERKSGLKGGSLVRAIARGQLPEAVVVGHSTLRWWEHEVDEALARLPRGKGQKRVKREPTEASISPLVEDHNGGPPLDAKRKRQRRVKREPEASP